MRLPPAAILAGVARTLEDDVLPAVADRAARGLVFTALELLANVQHLVEWRADVREEELAGAAVSSPTRRAFATRSPPRVSSRTARRARARSTPRSPTCSSSPTASASA